MSLNQDQTVKPRFRSCTLKMHSIYKSPYFGGIWVSSSWYSCQNIYLHVKISTNFLSKNQSALKSDIFSWLHQKALRIQDHLKIKLEQYLHNPTFVLKNQQYPNWKYIIKRLYYTPCSFQSAAAFVLTTLWPGRCMPCSSVWYTMWLKAIRSRSVIYKSDLSLTKLFTGSDNNSLR